MGLSIMDIIGYYRTLVVTIEFSGIDRHLFVEPSRLRAKHVLRGLHGRFCSWRESSDLSAPLTIIFNNINQTPHRERHQKQQTNDLPI